MKSRNVSGMHGVFNLFVGASAVLGSRSECYYLMSLLLILHVIDARKTSV